jgi:hypothetical protein
MALEKEQIDMLVEHLPYELNMLDGAYELLANVEGEDDHAKMLTNVYIECFFLHARNLIEFFTKTQKRTASASMFTHKRIDYELPDLMDQINDQISHPNLARGDNCMEPLTGSHIARIKGAIDRAVSLFQSKLKEDARTHWRNREAKSTEIPAAFYSSATNAIISVMSVYLPEPNDK